MLGLLDIDAFYDALSDALHDVTEEEDEVRSCVCVCACACARLCMCMRVCVPAPSHVPVHVRTLAPFPTLFHSSRAHTLRAGRAPPATRHLLPARAPALHPQLKEIHRKLETELLLLMAFPLKLNSVRRPEPGQEPVLPYLQKLFTAQTVEEVRTRCARLPVLLQGTRVPLGTVHIHGCACMCMCM